jgi:hypothetical protein
MLKYLPFCLILFISLFIDAAGEQKNYVEGELVIQLKPGADIVSIQNSYSDINLSPKQLLSGRMNIWLFTYDHLAIDDESVLFEIKQNKDVSAVQFNHFVQMRRAKTVFGPDGSGYDNILVTMPDDTRFNEQWALNNTGQSGGTVDADIDAPEAWDYTTGGLTALGDSIIIAVIDGGFDLNHPDLKYWKNYAEIPSNGIDDDGNGYIDDYNGWNAYNNNGNIGSDAHGTHVAGIAGAKGNNGLGIAGVNWNAKIMPIAGSSGTESIVIIAYAYALEMRARYNETNGQQGAFIVSTNASFGVDYGQPANFPLWCAIYDSLGMQGVLSCGATANLNINIDQTSDIPTGCPSPFMIAVTNTTRNDVKNTGAAYGLTTIDLGAPGTSILSTVPGSTYSNMTGTSMASPTVAGGVALMFAAAHVDLMSLYKSNYPSGALMFRDYMFAAVDTISSLIGKTVTGGRLNVHKAAVAVNQVVPVELVSFTAVNKANYIIISWSTATELNNAGFYLERKEVSDAEWKEIIFIKGRGNSLEPGAYSYNDIDMTPGKYLYRLRQTDIDGSFVYSIEIEAGVSAPADFVLMQNYPNPFNPTSKIKYNVPESGSSGGWMITIKLYDVLGNEISTLVNENKTAGSYEVELNSSSLSSGIYIYRMTVNDNVFNSARRMVVLK